MALLQEFHGYWAFLLIILNFIGAVWGLLAHWRGWPLPRLYWIIIILAQVAVFPQVLAGIALWLSGARPGSGWQHLIYGVAAVFGVSVGLFYRSRMRLRPGLLYGMVSLFIFFAAFRGLLTGHG
jgi:hypothetical protein